MVARRRSLLLLGTQQISASGEVDFEVEGTRSTELRGWGMEF